MSKCFGPKNLDIGYWTFIIGYSETLSPSQVPFKIPHHPPH
jgi:hypothetical protein